MNRRSYKLVVLNGESDIDPKYSNLLNIWKNDLFKLNDGVAKEGIIIVEDDDRVIAVFKTISVINIISTTCLFLYSKKQLDFIIEDLVKYYINHIKSIIPNVLYANLFKAKIFFYLSDSNINNKLCIKGKNCDVDVFKCKLHDELTEYYTPIKFDSDFNFITPVKEQPTTSISDVSKLNPVQTTTNLPTSLTDKPLNSTNNNTTGFGTSTSSSWNTTFADKSTTNTSTSNGWNFSSTDKPTTNTTTNGFGTGTMNFSFGAK